MGMLGVRRSAPNWTVLRECPHEPLQLCWIRASINGMLSSKSATFRQAPPS